MVNKKMVISRNNSTRSSLMTFAFFCLLVFSIVSMLNFATAWRSTILSSAETTINFTSAWNGSIVNENYVGGNRFKGHIYNISINNSAGATSWNITSVNITFWNGTLNYSNALYGVYTGSNGTGNLTTVDAGGNVWFNITNDGMAQTLSWKAGNTTGATLLWGNSSQTAYFWFNATAPNPGKYNITVRVTYNQTASGQTALLYNETNITIWINDTTPIANITFYGNGLDRTVGAVTNAGNYSGDLVLNVSMWENSNEIRSVLFNISFFNYTTNGTVWTFAAANTTTSPDYWTYTLDTTKLPDGHYNLTVLANDTNGNWVGNFSVNITIDNTIPTGTFSCNPTEDLFVGQTVTCTCSPADTFTGINVSGTTYTANPSTTDAGSITQTCVFRDMAGNLVTLSDSYTIWGNNIGGSSSGGGSSTSTPTISMFAEITPAAPVTVTNFASDSGVKQIKVEVSQTANNVQVSAVKYGTTQPPAVSTSKSGVYKYVKIETQNLANKLSKATMTIDVNKTWVSGQSLTKDDIAVYKYDNASSQWNELTTTYSSEDTNYYYYTVEVGSFSYFAIAPKPVTTTEEPSTTTEEPSTTENQSSIGLLSLPYWAWIIIGVIILAVIGIIILKRKK